MGTALEISTESSLATDRLMGAVERLLAIYGVGLDVPDNKMSIWLEVATALRDVKREIALQHEGNERENS